MKAKDPGEISALIPVRIIENRILLIRGQKVILDSDLAELYQVKTGNLNLAVRRNLERFPDDFMFQLTHEEFQNLKLQFAISSWGGRRYPPYAFNEQGIAMLSSVLTSARAVQVNIAIMRAFVRLRQLLATHQELGQRMDEIERRQLDHDSRFERQDQQIEAVFATIEQMIAAPSDTPKRRIGFRLDDDATDGED